MKKKLLYILVPALTLSLAQAGRVCFWVFGG